MIMIVINETRVMNWYVWNSPMVVYLGCENAKFCRLGIHSNYVDMKNYANSLGELPIRVPCFHGSLGEHELVGRNMN